jgi:hypothetical protein
MSFEVCHLNEKSAIRINLGSEFEFVIDSENTNRTER